MEAHLVVLMVFYFSDSLPWCLHIWISCHFSSSCILVSCRKLLCFLANSRQDGWGSRWVGLSWAPGRWLLPGSVCRLIEHQDFIGVYADSRIRPIARVHAVVWCWCLQSQLPYSELCGRILFWSNAHYPFPFLHEEFSGREDLCHCCILQHWGGVWPGDCNIDSMFPFFIFALTWVPSFLTYCYGAALQVFCQWVVVKLVFLVGGVGRKGDRVFYLLCS